MAGYRATQIRIPANETEFEKNCVVLFRELLGDPGTKRVGTRGQKQHGLDIIGHRDRDVQKLVGIQCKLKTGKSKLTKKEVLEHIEMALAYRPHLSEYFIVATSKDDEKLLPLAEEAMRAQRAAGRTVYIEIGAGTPFKSISTSMNPPKTRSILAGVQAYKLKTSSLARF